MLWSIGKDSTVMLWLARKAFFGHVPFPLVHVDTAYKIPEMIEGKPETKTLEPISVIGKCTEKEALKVLKENYGKDKAITVCSIEVDEATYEITVEDFLAHAKKIEKTETEEN